MCDDYLLVHLPGIAVALSAVMAVAIVRQWGCPDQLGELAVPSGGRCWHACLLRNCYLSEIP